MLTVIARGLSQLGAYPTRTAVARTALERFYEFIRTKRSFALETTLSGVTHLLMLQGAADEVGSIRSLPACPE